MKNKRTFVGLALLVAVMVLGIGYAAVSNIELKINGQYAAKADDNNFKVSFDRNTAATATALVGTATADYTSETVATFDVRDLTTKDQTATFVYAIHNESEEIGATLTAAVTNNNTTWYDVTYEFGKTALDAGENTTITVTVKLLKTPVTEADETAAVGTGTVTITAVPKATA